jgi:NitT/TauT family transport system substrate-binding protein
MSLIVAIRHPGWTRIAVIGLLIVLCGSLSAAEELQPIRIALTREASAAPMFVTVAAGYFNPEGLDPQLAFLESDAAVSAAVASGTADIGLASLSPAFYGYASTHGLKIIASRSSDKAGFPMYALLIGKKARAAGLSDARGLPHRRIGVAGTHSGAYYALFNVASRFRLDPDSFTVISLQSPAAELDALSGGDVDAALLPFATAAHSVQGGEGLLLLSNFAEWQQGVVFTTADRITTKRALVEQFMRAYQRGTADHDVTFQQYDDAGDFIPGPHYAEYLDAIAREARLPRDTVARTKSYCDRRANLDVADIESQVHFWQTRGQLGNSVAASKLIDSSFIGAETAAPQSSRRQ